MSGDAKSAIAHLLAKQDAYLSFFFKIEVKDENRLNRLFWANSISH